MYANMLQNFVHPFSVHVYAQQNLKMHQDNAPTHSGAAKHVLDQIGVSWVIINSLIFNNYLNLFFLKE
jgi:hypothetical protein